MSRVEAVSLSELSQFLIGQEQDLDAMTGCSVIIAPEGAVCGVDVRGGSPSTRDTDALSPLCNRKCVHAIVLSGGSAFGLDASAGVMKLLEEKQIGRDVKVTVVPNVCGAVLFDLKCANSKIRPDADMGYRAGSNAFAKLPFRSGNYGAGTGATIGKAAGLSFAMKGGIGQAAFRYGELLVGAVFAVNCVGDVIENGKIIAGARAEDGKHFADSEEIILSSYSHEKDFFSENTVIGCIMTNAILDKSQATRIAAQGHNGIAMTVAPAHTIFDGDTVFALSCGDVQASQDAVGILAKRATAAAIVDAVKSAESFKNYAAYRDISSS